jgi:hypothetical protein
MTLPMKKATTRGTRTFATAVMRLIKLFLDAVDRQGFRGAALRERYFRHPSGRQKNKAGHAEHRGEKGKAEGM